MTNRHEQKTTPRWLWLLMACGTLLFSPAAWAEPPAKGATASAKPVRVQRMDFSDDEVLATVDRGDGYLVMARTTPMKSSLVVVRDNFIPEMLKSAEDI